MKRDAGFYEWVLHDLFNGIRGITSRSMFGGYGFYLNGAIFGIIADGRLYFKTDESAMADFKKHGSQPFRYSAKDRTQVTMGYWELPEEIMEDRDKLIAWVKRAAATSKKKLTRKDAGRRK